MSTHFMVVIYIISQNIIVASAARNEYLLSKPILSKTTHVSTYLKTITVHTSQTYADNQKTNLSAHQKVDQCTSDVIVNGY